MLRLLAEAGDQRGDGGRLARSAAMIDVLQKRNIDLALRVSRGAGARSWWRVLPLMFPDGLASLNGKISVGILP
jgi:hypothetical protein